ncbi:hypothetical protein [Deinococcus ficus]|uniref:hypothetical protein n=1 Tax=Deinococcus ficus TaxID=317577 RepID=UPI00131C48C3|nr:hypothetical protein [Deinococcus ficus]
MTKTKRTKEEILRGTAEIVLINGNEYSPKRLKVFEVQAVLNEKAETIKKISTLQRKLQKTQKLYESGELEKLGMTEDEALDFAAEIQDNIIELSKIVSVDHNLWLLERFYPEAKESGDLYELDYGEDFDAALEAIFVVNPSLGKSKAILLMNPMNQNG